MKKYFLLIFILLSAGTGFGQNVNLPLDHYAYDFFYRMETKGVLEDVVSNKPILRIEASEYVMILDSLNRTDPYLFTKLDKKIIERLKGEFRFELRNKKCSIKKSETEPHFYKFTGNNKSAFFDIVMGAEILSVSGESQNIKNYQQAYYGGIIRGSFKNISFYSDVRIFGETGQKYTQHYNAYSGYPQGVSKDSTFKTWDKSDAYLSFSIKGILVQFGRQNIKWGNSLFSPLFLSDNAPSFDMLKIYVPFSRKVNFTYIHGELRSDYSHKWIAAHRIEFLPFDKFSIGFNESVVYGKRGIESAYLNPLIPYLIAEHTLGDRDNVCMGIDFKLLPIRNVKIYGELFIDDLFSPFDLFENYWGNKLAFQTGLSLEDPFKINNSRFTAEYTRIDPFVYTHEDTVNIYENYTYGLGHFLRPNSDMINVEFIKRFSLFMQSKISFMHIRHGRGEINISHTEEDGELKNFLKGTLEITDKKEISFNFQPKRDVYINFVLRNMSVVNPENIQGKKFSWNEFTLNTSFNW